MPAVKGTNSGNAAWKARSTGEQKLVHGIGPESGERLEFSGMTVAAASPAPKRTRIQQEKRELILEAALEVFSANGFRGATIDQIAEAAGMSKPESRGIGSARILE